MKKFDAALDKIVGSVFNFVGMVLLGGMIAATGALPILIGLIIFEQVTGVRIPCPFVPSLAL